MYNKYRVQKKQVSNDNGQTWSDVTPAETRQGEYIDSYQTLAECEYVDYSTQYLTFESQSNNNTITFKKGQNVTAKTISASTDNGNTWTAYTSTTGGTTLATLNNGEKLLVKGVNSAYGTGTYGGETYYNRFLGSGAFEVYGNVTSLIYGDDYEESGTTIGNYAFQGLFYNSDNLISAKNIVFPSTTIGSYSYGQMFHRCHNLVEAPSSINVVNGNSACMEMFRACSGLTTPPSLPSTTLGGGCYYWMFGGCTSLTTAPELPATTLVNSCYGYMFNGCTNLNYIKCLATNISSSSSLRYWVENVASTGTFVKAASMNDWTTGNNGIPTNWTVQDA